MRQNIANSVLNFRKKCLDKGGKKDFNKFIMSAQINNKFSKKTKGNADTIMIYFSENDLPGCNPSQLRGG